MQKESDRARKKKDEFRDEEEFGTFQYADGSVYEGKICHREAPVEIPHGTPVPPSAPPSRGQQQLEPPVLIPFQHGKGVFKDAGGAIYDGGWSEGNMCGEGVIQFPSGAVYTGGMYINSFYGSGKYTWPDGSYYEGQWENNKMHGLGTYVDDEGRHWVGKFYQGRAVDLLAEISL
ncbi:MORN motif [Trypanosoma melophagium]|uniref:MORN motif n=1 Tax=Trypanosoma melophagium TaxID=715481 RepID=UPI003519DE06|nr:MORN motif [Trypanosoma melophagium]